MFAFCTDVHTPEIAPQGGDGVRGLLRLLRLLPPGICHDAGREPSELGLLRVRPPGIPSGASAALRYFAFYMFSPGDFAPPHLGQELIEEGGSHVVSGAMSAAYYASDVFPLRDPPWCAPRTFKDSVPYAFALQGSHFEVLAISAADFVSYISAADRVSYIFSLRGCA